MLGALCYEAMFPELIRENSLHVLPDLIVNPVNDSWFGNTIENHQHYNASKLRAIEMGRPLIRVALSGISGAVDALGNELILPIHIGEEDFRIFELKLQKRDTLYFKYGNWTLFVLYLFFLSLDRVLNKILRK